MSLINKVKLAMQTAKAVSKGALEGKDIFVSDLDAQKRMDICKGCPFLKDFVGQPQCEKCGCFMVAKSKLTESTCPEGKW
jgi:hypothetical protein